jgi:hypothetical protein
MYIHRLNELDVLRHIADRFGLHLQATRRTTDEISLFSSGFGFVHTSADVEILAEDEITWEDIRACLHRAFVHDWFESAIVEILSSMSGGASILENPPIIYDNETFEDPNEGKPIIGYKAYEDDDRAEWFGFIEKLQGTPL